jgi:hypothetical protein
MRALELDLRAPDPGPKTPAPRPATPKPAPARAARPAPPAPPAAEARCDFCGYGLPKDREVRFCPHCGVDQESRQCGQCGAGMESGWRFCIACGTAAES